MAVLTAALAGLFSILGSYYTAKFQMTRAVGQKQLEYKISTYTAFLDKIDSPKTPATSQILTIGSMANHLSTDHEIQEFEAQISHVLANQDIQNLYWQLNSHLNTLRLLDAPRVARTCDDILKILLLRDHEIDWSKYSVDVADFYNRWKNAQVEGSAYGWKERVSPDDRLMVIMIAKLTEILIAQLRDEIHSTLANISAESFKT